MKDQWLLLLELQKIDSRVHEIRKSMEALPDKLLPAKQDLAKLESMLNIEKERLAESERWRKEQEELVKADEEGLKNAKSKLQAAKNPRDYAAASREVDNKRKSISEREEEILKLIEAIDKARAEVEDHEKDVDKLRSHIAEQEGEVVETLKTLEAEAEKRAEGRDEMTHKLDPRVLKRYEDTLRKRGYALAPVDDGVCLGCHMQVPPQLNNVIARNESIEICPSCKRLLYRKDFLGLEDDDAS